MDALELIIEDVLESETDLGKLAVRKVEELGKKAPKKAEKDTTPTTFDLSTIYSAIESSPTKAFTLDGPTTVVVKNKKGFRNKPHIGGEYFRLIGLYTGVSGNLIFQFAPTAAEDYELAEFTEAGVRKHMADFNATLRLCGADDLIKQGKIAKSKLAEEAKNKGKVEQYGDLGFGSW